MKTEVKENTSPAAAETDIENLPKKKKSRYWQIVIVLTVLTILLALLGFIPALCDLYANNVYIYLCDGIARITNLVPFCIGEIVMYLGAAMLLFGVIFLILLIFLRKKPKYRRFCGGYFKTFLLMLCCVLFLYMPMWYIPFRSTVLGEGNSQKRTDFTYDEIYALLEYTVNGANAAAEEIEIAEDGTVVFPTEEEVNPLIADAMRAISDDYTRLKGYYPKVKPAMCSDILERMWIGGFTYPFTKEATHNKYLSPTYQPILDAHELAHHKGYYKENEAEFLSQIALTQSDDPLLRLSAFCQMHSFVWDEYEATMTAAIEKMYADGTMERPDVYDKESLEKYFLELQKYFKPEPCLSQKVFQIMDAGAVIEQEIYEEDSHPIDEMPAVNEVIEETADVGWETQGEILQENTYDGVTLLLLQYFDGKLY